MKKLFVLFAVTSVLSTSCATIFTGTKQTVQINSYPQGAKIEVDGIERGVTPAPVEMKKGFKGQTLVLKKEGYENKIFQPTMTFNNVAILNLMGMLGWGIDAATGALMKYDPVVYEITLEPTKSSAKTEVAKPAESKTESPAQDNSSK